MSSTPDSQTFTRRQALITLIAGGVSLATLDPLGRQSVQQSSSSINLASELTKKAVAETNQFVLSF